MQKYKALIFLFLMGFNLFPWPLVCTAHPFGDHHDHHDHDGLSPCEMRENYNGTDTVVWPPMHCDHITSELDELQSPQHITISQQHWIVLMVVTDLTPYFDYQNQYFPLPEPRCRSAPIISAHTLRGPPALV
jgi:hypothetical protein